MGVVGIPHIFDSVVFTNLSYGLLGSHIAAFCCGVNDDDVLVFAWPWATPEIPNPVNVIIVATRTMDKDTLLKDAFTLLMIKWIKIAWYKSNSLSELNRYVKFIIGGYLSLNARCPKKAPRVVS